MSNPTGKSGPRDKPFRDALRMEIATAQDENDFRSLRMIARNLLKTASEGDVQAIKEVADRLDGKVAQAHVGDDDADPIKLIHEIRRVLVDPKHSDGKSI